MKHLGNMAAPTKSVAPRAGSPAKGNVSAPAAGNSQANTGLLIRTCDKRAFQVSMERNLDEHE